jgi:hypothetical protein
MFYKKTVIFLFVVSCLGSLHAQTVDEIISKYVQYIGGEQQWSTIKTIITSGTYDYGGIVFPFTSYSKAPDLYKYIVTSNGKSFQQAFDGSNGWKIDGFKNETKKTVLTGKAATAMANEADVELESPLINYKTKGHSAMLEGTDTVNEQVCFRVRFIRNNGDTERYFFSTENFELVKKQAVSKNEELDSSLIDIFYSDYREVNGIKMPFKSVTKAGEQTILTIIIEKVDFDEPVSDDEFKP